MNINPFDLLKNASKIQEQMNGFQEKLGAISATGAAAGGMVEIDISGKMEVLAVRIAPQMMDGGDVEMLQDLIIAAFTDSIAKVKEKISGEVGAITGGMNIPGFPGM
ncbi:MAG: YbaB/EbfC family nucleoid-associated protein [Treponema sp.]|nr:YbaB/EbfC family nucleoid-associated protein [Treponema sp.]